MQTKEFAPTVAAKSTEPQKTLERQPDREAVNRQNTPAPRAISQPVGTPPPGIQALLRNRAGGSGTSRARDVLQLQRRYGNRYVQKKLDAGERGGRTTGPGAEGEAAAVGNPANRRLPADTGTPGVKPNRPAATSRTEAPSIQRAWYNVSIPFTDYQFDPSLEGLKTAGNLAADKAKEGAAWAKDKVVSGVEWLFDKIKDLVNSGIDWLTEKFDEIQEFAKSSFTDIKTALSSALGGITAPIASISSAFANMDAGILGAAWRALSAGANAAWQAVKSVTDRVLTFGGGVWNTVSGHITSLLDTVNGLFDSAPFKLLPDALQSGARSLFNKIRALWKSVQDFWKDFWARLTSFVRNLLKSVEDFVQKVLSYAIDKVISTVKTLKEVYDFVKRFVTDPEGVIKPIVAQIAGKIKSEAPGKTKDVAQQKMKEALAGGQSAPASKTTIHRSPDGPIRTTASRKEIDDTINKTFAVQWAALDIPKMLWDTFVNMFWPPATIRAIGHEFYELWNTDWKNAADGLFSPRSIVDDFGGFWHDVWSNLLVLLDFPLALWRRLNSILMLLMGYVSIILILVGLVGGAIAGNVPGALAGAAAGAQLSFAIGEALFLSFLLAEGTSAVKAYVDLISARQTEQEKGRDYMQFVASTMGIGIALVIVLIFAIIGALVSKVVALIKGKTPPKQLEAPKTDPPTEEPKTEAETVPGKGALIADIQNALASLKTVREAIRQTPRPAERAPLEARAQQIEERLGRLKEDAGRAVTPDDLQRTRQELQEAQTDIDGLKRDAKVAEVPGRPTLQEGVRTARQRAANIRQRVEGLRGNDQAELRPRVDAVDAELGRLERTAQDVPTQEQVSRLNDALDKVLKEMDAMEKDPLLELGLRGEAVRALESLENIKRDPVGDINSKVNERGDPKNHYEAARREAAGEVIARRADGRPFSHVGDLQRAFDGLDNVRRALQREMDNPAPSTTPRGLDVLVKKFSEVQQLLSRLKGFLDSIGQGNFPPYHEFPPGA